MQSISTRIDDEMYGRLEEIVENRGSSMSAVVRDLIDKGMRYEDLEARHADLQRQLAAVNSRQEDVTELVEYVQQERELTRYRERRQRLLDDANILKRWAWKVTGVPVDGGED